MAGRGGRHAELGRLRRAPRRSRAARRVTSGRVGEASGSRDRAKPRASGRRPRSRSDCRSRRRSRRSGRPRSAGGRCPGLTIRPQSTAHTARSTRIRCSAVDLDLDQGGDMLSEGAVGRRSPSRFPAPPPSQPPSAAAVDRQRASRGLSPSICIRKESGSTPASRASSSMKLSVKKAV